MRKGRSAFLNLSLSRHRLRRGRTVLPSSYLFLSPRFTCNQRCVQLYYRSERSRRYPKMDNDSWQYLMSSSSRPLSQFRSDGSNDYEEAYWDEDGEEIYTEFPCPYCNDDFDLVELCCHIEDVHFAQAKTGVCPVCAVGVSSNMITHLTKQHGKMIKIQHKLKLSKGKPDANLSLLLKEFHEEYLKSLLDGSSMASPPLAMEPDPLLSSFFYNVPPVAQSESLQLNKSTEPSCSEYGSVDTTLERETASPPLSDKEHEEKAQISEFVQGLVWSTFFVDNL